MAVKKTITDGVVRIDVNDKFSYYYHENNPLSYTYVSYNDIQSDTLSTSYRSYKIDLATLNFDLANIKDSGLFKDNNNNTLIDNNLLVVSMLDDKMFYDRNASKTSYQYNSVLFINNENNIIPLSLNIQDINSALTIENNEIQTKIDDNTIVDIDGELNADYTKFRLANSESTGIFKVDNDSLMINNDSVTLSYSIADVIDNIDEHITIMNNVIKQCNDSLDKVIVTFKEYPLFDKKYSCNINQNYNLYYSDETKNNILMFKKNNEIDHYYYIDYNQKYFKVKIKIVYNYLSSNISDFNPFNEDNLTITLEDTTDYPTVEKMTDNSSEFDLSKYIKYNNNKSYIFNEGVVKFDESTNNIFGEVNYICYFDIVKELDNVIKNNTIGNVPNCFSFKLNFKYLDHTIGIESSTYANLDLFVDRYQDELQLHQMLYHDYSVGFNYDGIGQQVGICMIPNNNNYKYDNNLINKPIFMKYFNNENNYIINRISDDILKSENIKSIRCSNAYNNGDSGDNDKLLTMPKLIDSSNIHDNIILYKNFDINSIDVISNNSNWYHMSNTPNSINKLFRTKSIYGKYLEYAFNDTYNICGNGLRKGDCYVPCLSELALFYLYGFYPYVNYIEDESYEIVNNQKIIQLDSSTLYYDVNTKNIYIYSIDFSNINNVKVKGKTLVGNLKINEYGQYISNGGKTIHRSISLFKLPDYSILSGPNYYLTYDKESNYEIINYSIKNNITIYFRLYNKYRSVSNLDFKLYSDDKTITTSLIRINKENGDIYSLSFSITQYTKKYNDIDVYYEDLDESFNTEEVIINENSQTQPKYRRLCKLSIKIE